MKPNDIVVVVSHPVAGFKYVNETGVIVGHDPRYLQVQFSDGDTYLFLKSELRPATEKEKATWSQYALYKTSTQVLGLADFIPSDTRPCVMDDIYGTKCHVGDMVIFASSYGDHGINMYKGTITAFGKSAPVVDAILPGGEKQTFRLQRPRFIKL